MNDHNADLFAFPSKEAADGFADDVRKRGWEAIVTTSPTPGGDWLVAVRDRPVAPLRTGWRRTH